MRKLILLLISIFTFGLLFWISPRTTFAQCATTGHACNSRPEGCCSGLECCLNGLCAVIGNCPVSPGTCRCSGSMSGSCTPPPTFDNCSTGYVAQCRTSGMCLDPGCDCVLESSLPCGHVGQSCCSSGTLCFPPAIQFYSGSLCSCQQGTLPAIGGFRPALCSDGISISTALGCIPVKDTQAFTEFLLKWGIGIAGGIAFLLIVYAAFMIITSSGNPQKLQAGKELLTAAFVGLILLILSAFILRVIGKDILKIFP